MQKYADYIKQIEIDALWSGRKHIIWDLDRQVNILNQNEEYAIVEPNSYYGLQEYDYIVLYANSIHMGNYFR